MKIQYYKSKRNKIHKTIHNKENFILYAWTGNNWHKSGIGTRNWLSNQCCSLDHFEKISEKEAFIELL